MTDWHEIYRLAREWTLEAGEQIKFLMTKEIIVEEKTHKKDLVTNIDRAIEKFLAEKIQHRYPSHLILGEETYGHQISELDGIIWMIDPIDGTMNFIHEKRDFAISIGIYEDGLGKIGLIYDVMANELFHCMQGEGLFLNDLQFPRLQPALLAESLVALNSAWFHDNPFVDKKFMNQFAKDIRGARTIGSAAIQLAYVATGKFDAYLSMKLCPWDIAAGIVMLNEVGGVITTFNGETCNLLITGSVFAAKPTFHEQFYRNYSIRT